MIGVFNKRENEKNNTKCKVRAKHLCLWVEKKCGSRVLSTSLCRSCRLKKASIWPLYPEGDASVYHYTGVIDKVSTRGGRELP